MIRNIVVLGFIGGVIYNFVIGAPLVAIGVGVVGILLFI